MAQPFRAPPLSLTSFLTACIGMLALLDSAVLAQVNGPGPSPSSSFDTVFNLPDDDPPLDGSFVGVGGVPGQTTQINIGDGSVIDRRFIANAGSEVNISGGSVSTAFVAGSGSEVNLSGGTVVYGFNESFVADSGSNVNISGGAVTTRFNARSDSLVNVSGGTFGDIFGIGPGSLVNISGGIFDDFFIAQSGSEVNLAGSEFYLDGVALTGLLPGQPVTITDRDVTLSGVLADGEQFSFDLNAVQSNLNDYFDPSSTLTVTIAVPEPSSLTLIAMALTMGFVQRRRP